MRTNLSHLALLAVLACASCAADPAQTPGADGLLPYAQVKGNLPRIVPRDTLKWVCHSKFPIRGLAEGFGGFGTRRATIYLIDIDARMLRRIVVDWNPPGVGQRVLPEHYRQVIWSDRSAALSPDDLNPIIGQMNRIWRKGVSEKPELQPLGVTAATALFDGSAAFNDSGSGNHAPDKSLDAAVYALAERKLALSKYHPEKQTGIPCDP